MKIGLMGFGRAGRAVASVLLSHKTAHLSWVMRKSNIHQHRTAQEYLGCESKDQGQIISTKEMSAEELLGDNPVDTIIDFSGAKGIHYYGEAAARKNIAIVSAISDYPMESIEFLRKLSMKTRVLWSPNITIGINFLMMAAKVLKSIAPYADVEIIEEHFKAKRDTSGTARRIATSLQMGEENIKTIRAGGIVGCHEVLFGFPYQTLRLRHESISREAFGNGALFAALHLKGKDNGLYAMEDLLMPYFSKGVSPA